MIYGKDESIEGYGINELLDMLFFPYPSHSMEDAWMIDVWFVDEWLVAVGPMDFLISWILPIFVVVLFWMYRQATPGKMVIRARIVDAKTGEKPTTGQYIVRYFAYFPSYLLLGLGILWVAFDKRKQGWHDKLAGTVVVRKIALQNQQDTSAKHSQPAGFGNS